MRRSVTRIKRCGGPGRRFALQSVSPGHDTVALFCRPVPGSLSWSTATITAASGRCSAGDMDVFAIVFMADVTRQRRIVLRSAIVVASLRAFPYPCRSCFASGTEQPEVSRFRSETRHAAGARVTLHFVPAYCPHLNPTERLWGVTHKHLTQQVLRHISRIGSDAVSMAIGPVQATLRSRA
jgi:hypothetical protein